VAFQQKLVKDNQAAEAQLLSRTVPPARSKIGAPTPEQAKAAVAANLTKPADKKAKAAERARKARMAKKERER